jgi:glyoxylase-like metal-dependent hydrolase (beta-lactamase superfamily II)
MTATPLLKSRQLLEGLWSIDGPANDLMYLVTGTRRAMLVDTGMGLGDLAGMVRGLTDLPLTVVNTHGHPDHAGEGLLWKHGSGMIIYNPQRLY